jgi:hypothetical protein
MSYPASVGEPNRAALYARYGTSRTAVPSEKVRPLRRSAVTSKPPSRSRPAAPRVQPKNGRVAPGPPR